jgi:D-tyrosyl-tRNA(Tyr) deacylase
MRAVIQARAMASVISDGTLAEALSRDSLYWLELSMMIREDVEWLADKIRQMRIFSDNEGKMNLSLAEIEGISWW